MKCITFRDCKRVVQKDARIYVLVYNWYDGEFAELLLWQNRAMLRRLVMRAMREIEYNASRRVPRANWPNVPYGWYRIA